jgi:hypothetical protein
MTLPVYPSLPGLTLTVLETPKFSTLVEFAHASGDWSSGRSLPSCCAWYEFRVEIRGELAEHHPSMAVFELRLHHEWSP